VTVKAAMIGRTAVSYDDALTYASRSAIGDYTSAGDIDFVTGLPSTITDDQNGFIAAGFLDKDWVKVSGSVSNDGYYLITTVEAGTLTLSHVHVLTNESGATGTITLSTPTQGVVLGVEGDSASHSEISDANSDTKIECEKNLNEDLVRVTVGGSEVNQFDPDGLTQGGVGLMQFSYFCGGF